MPLLSSPADCAIPVPAAALYSVLYSLVCTGTCNEVFQFSACSRTLGSSGRGHAHAHALGGLHACTPQHTLHPPHIQNAHTYSSRLPLKRLSVRRANVYAHHASIYPSYMTNNLHGRADHGREETGDGRSIGNDRARSAAQRPNDSGTRDRGRRARVHHA